MNRQQQWIRGFFVLAVMAAAACGDGVPTAPDEVATSSSTGSTGSSGSTGGTTTPTSLAYVQDIKPIMDADCTRCHAGSRPDGGVNLSSYANVMRQVTAGSAGSRLIRETASNGSMYRYLSGNRTTKSNTIRSWIVDFKAVETR